MSLYTVVLRQSGSHWVALSLENGIVGQGDTQDMAMAKLKEATQSFQVVCDAEDDIYSAPIPIQELHEFLTVEAVQPIAEVYKFRSVYAL